MYYTKEQKIPHTKQKNKYLCTKLKNFGVVKRLFIIFYLYYKNNESQSE